MIDKIDKDNMYKSILDFSDNILDAVKLGDSIKFLNDYSSINKIIVAGMGGSAIGGDVSYARKTSSEVPIKSGVSHSHFTFITAA